MAQLLNVGTSDFARDPPTGGNAVIAFQDIGGWRSDFAVESHRSFERNQRRVMADVAGEGFIQAASLLFQATDLNLYTGRAELFESLPADFRIRIGHGRDHATYSGRDERIRAGRRAALMSVGLKVDIERGSTSFRTGRFEGKNFGMLHAVVGVGSGSDYGPLSICDHGAYIRIGRGQAQAFARQLQSALDELIVGGVSRHSGRNLTRSRG